MIIKFFIVIFIGIVFSFLHRVRGSDIKVQEIEMDTFAKLGIGISIGIILYFKTHWNIFFCEFIGYILYKIGESFGWGTWIATIIDKDPKNYNPEKSCGNFFGYRICDGISQITEVFISHEKNYLLYANVALFIRGLYFWVPPFIPFLILSPIYLIYIFILSISFPISVNIPCLINIPKYPHMDNKWSQSEVIYGFIQGIVFGVVLM